jgi:hypothetical protein
MSVIELKSELHLLIDKLQDMEILQNIKYLAEQANLVPMTIEELNERLNKAEQQSREGKTRSHEEVRQLIESWKRK